MIVLSPDALADVERYAALAETGDILVTRIWHGREARI
jgi:hypothetical protein